MSFKPTNILQPLNESVAYGAGCGYGAEQLQHVLRMLPAFQSDDAFWHRGILLAGFEADEVSVKRNGRQFIVEAMTESRREDGDFNRLRRCVQLPDEVDAESLRCWMLDDLLVLQAPLLQHQKQQQLEEKELQQLQQLQLVDTSSALVKDKAAGRTRWQLTLAMPEFYEDEIRIERQEGKVVIVAENKTESDFASASSQLRREFQPPTGVQLDALSWSFDNGVLRIEAPAPGLKPKRHSRIATITRELRSSPHFQEKPHCVIC